jgi:hypothetical protein
MEAAEVIAKMVPVTSIITRASTSNTKREGEQLGATTKLERPQSFWHGLCSQYEELVNTNAKKISHADQVRSNTSA